MGLKPCCQLCPAAESLLRCSGCKVARYCSKTHQASDWPQHKSACKDIKDGYARLDREEQKLRNQPSGSMLAPANVFEEHVGVFWLLDHTRSYMGARYVLVDEILKVRTYDAVLAALDHVMDCLRLCRSDNMGARDFVPSLFLRLGRDQECYDFVRWCSTRGNYSEYNWGGYVQYDWSDVDESANVKNTDVLESPQYLCEDHLNLNHAIAIILLKIKLLLNVRAGSQGREILEPSQTFNQIRGNILQNATGDIERENVEVIKVLKSHVNILYEAIDRTNSLFWGALIHPGRNLDARPISLNMGSKGEMQLLLQRYYDAWTESAGAIEVIKAILEKNDY